MNQFELDCEIVKADLEAKGVKAYSFFKGNNCVGCSYGRIVCYYIVKDGKITDIIYD